MVTTEVTVKRAELRTRLLSTTNTNRAGAGIPFACDCGVGSFLLVLRLVLVRFETVVLRLGIVGSRAAILRNLVSGLVGDGLTLLIAYGVIGGGRRELR